MSNEPVGLLKRGTIVDFDQEKSILHVRLNIAPAIKGNQAATVEVQAPHSLFYNNGLFIGTVPVPGTPVVVGQGSGGQYNFVSFLSEERSPVPNLDPGVLLIHSTDDTRITLDLNDNIRIGSPVTNIHINTNSNYISTNFYAEYNFTQASRKINGVVKRDTNFNKEFSQGNKLESDDYDDDFTVIGMDPTVPVTRNLTGSDKNPALVENRELIYEFQYLSNIENDKIESSRYSKSPDNPTFTKPNRRISRADTLSLSLVAPNYLMETIKGTVVDIFGNLLDLNRLPLPIGQEQTTLKSESTDKVKSFLLIKEIERKSLAYHFEINARKDLIKSAGSAPTLPDVNSNDDYARARSRFFLDIDKEGQFKLNVPASSERGNIPLLTRYENYSTFGTEDNNNPNKLIGTKDNKDIYHDSFAAPPTKITDEDKKNTQIKGSIRLVGDDGNSDSSNAPKDRITKQAMKHGTAYHDILKTCFMFQETDNRFIDYAGGIYAREDINNIKNMPPLTNIVSNTIPVSGPNAKAGGRSGSLNFDGMIEMNIGANSIDRQSWWLDTAGSLVANIGRDKNGRSILAATDGDFILQVGGFGIQGDSRFVNTQNNTMMAAVLDLRIFNGAGHCHIIRCDSKGITIMSPGNVAVHANGVLELTSNTSIRMDAPRITIHERTVLNAPLGSI